MPELTAMFSVLPSSSPKAQNDLLEAFKDSLSKEDLDLISPELVRDMIDMQWDLTQNRNVKTPSISVRCGHAHEGSPKKTIIDIVSNDYAFLIDSIAAKINTDNLLVELVLHPIVGVERDKNGKIIGIHDKNKQECDRESHIHIHVKEALSQEEMARLEKGLSKTIADVMLANRDWRFMMDEIKKARRELETAKTKTSAREVSQYCDFLDYLYDNNFTFLGYREYEFKENKKGIESKTKHSNSLGILDDKIKPAYINDHEEGLPHHLQKLRMKLPAVYVSKTNRISTVHRRVPMDAIAIKTYDKNGNVKGEKLFLGLFTSVTYSRSVSDVPYLREKVEAVMKQSDYLEGSHNRKALRHILEKYPRDELFQIPADDLLNIAKDILRLQERQRIALFTRQDPFGRYISCLVYVPRDRFGTKLRKEISKVLEEELKGTCTSFSTTLDDSVFARVMFMIAIDDKKPSAYDSGDIEEKLQDIGQTWIERLSYALSEHDIDDLGGDIIALKDKYADAFPPGYTDTYTAKEAIYDINKIEKCLKENRITLDLYESKKKNGQMRLNVYSPNAPLNLSDVLPILENMGFRVAAELPFEIIPKDTGTHVWMHDFELNTNQKTCVDDFKNNKEAFETAFKKVWYKDIENDTLNALVANAGISWRETTILRAYVNYTKQIYVPFSLTYIRKALNSHPKLSAQLVSYFKTLFDPSLSNDQRKKKSNQIASAMDANLQGVDSLDEDRIIRYMISFVEATLRTNYFQTDDNGDPKSSLSFKFDSVQIPGMPQPVPYREIFVYSPRVEAIHLRGGEVARGGLRWSDRHEDFRTEVLGLMKAQMVKNAVIVPVGAKGGFVVKTPTNNRDEYRKEGLECYKIFIRGMLDITDNLDGDKVIPPKDVVRLDSDDPYLVVAADKGTATFSDTANAISEEYGFWMGDAFASGGSAGYDHKEMGITARGAWESVKLHFRHLNHNIQTEEFDAVGVGDMGGDVFGNGMLLSEKTCLIGAFNHLHIFVDPNPDPETSYKERQRLFDDGLGWDEYDQSLLSKGGAVYNRSEKTLELSPEIQKRFDLDKAKVSPNELMLAILKSRTDLIWFGGIGTYIKATSENNEEVGDKANDPIRVTGNDVRAKVIGEGANLAMTQLGRIEFAKNGGRLNTDFIDNSAGVDSSDHEVNIKILMRAVMSGNKNKMTVKKRNVLLEKMTETVGDHVLRNNYQQALAVSMTEFKAADLMGEHKDFISFLEQDINLNRDLEDLPTDVQITHRMSQGKGLTRPEICVLISYAKIQLTKDILASDVVTNDKMNIWLTSYFPEQLRKKYDKEIQTHKLNKDIIAMKLANSIVNRMGPSFVYTMRQKTGASYHDITKAYTIVREIFDLRALWDEIEAMDNKVPADVQMKAMHALTKTTRRCILWFLSHKHAHLDIDKQTSEYREAIETLQSNLKQVLSAHHQTNYDQKVSGYTRDGLSKKTAERIATVRILKNAPDIAFIAHNNNLDLSHAAETYFQIGETFYLDWLKTRSDFTQNGQGGAWHDEAMAGMVERLDNVQADLTRHVLKNNDTVSSWIEGNQNTVKDVRDFFNTIRSAGSVDLSMLIVAEQKLRRLYGG